MTEIDRLKKQLLENFEIKDLEGILNLSREKYIENFLMQFWKVIWMVERA